MKTLALILLLSLNVQAGIRVIGNGGNSVGPQSAGVEGIERLLPGSRAQIRAWITSKERRNNPTLIGSSRTAPMEITAFLGFLDSARIQFRTDSPCPSNSGHREGSIISLHPTVICISGFLLASLPMDSAPRELEALLVHELSHLLGADEEEAVRVQTDYLNAMRSLSRARVESDVERKLRVLFDTSSCLENHLTEISEGRGNTDIFLTQTLGTLKTDNLPMGSMNLLRADGGLTEGIHRWLRLIQLQLPGQASGPNWSRRAEDSLLDKVRRDGEVTLTDLNPLFFHGVTLRATRLENMADVEQELRRLQDALKQLSRKLREESQRPFPLAPLTISFST
ncbi:MAG: hypothetical protein KF789_05545 [Bdellovibrionaceae bacterium]|nr:hypothetical protein [Pseudobdellovibrionaceae bacterium]